MAPDEHVGPLVRLVALGGLVAASATVLLPAPAGLEGHRELAFAIGYAVVFLFAQRSGFLLHWRGHATRISVEEFTLVGGLLLLPPTTFVAAILASAIANQIVTRRSTPKAIFNVGQYALAAGVTAMSFVALALVVPPVWATVPAPFVFSAISQGSTALLFARLDGEHAWTVFRQRFLAWTLVAGVIGLSLGLGAFALWQLSPIAVLAVLPIFVLLARFGRLTEWAEEEVRVHKSLAEATTRVATTGDFDQVAAALLETCATVFGAGEARLTLALTPGAPREWTWRGGEGASAHAIRAAVRLGPAEEGELLVAARAGHRHFGARDRHLLMLIAASASSAALAHRSMMQVREANQRLTNANRELEEFTLWTTHDMREPLRSVGQLAAVLADDIDDLEPSEAKELARKIDRSAHLLKDRIKALHEFSRVVQEDVPFETVRLSDAWDAAVEGLRVRIDERGATVRRPQNLPIVRGQPARLEKVFANLVENALKHNHAPDPLVELVRIDAGDEWELSVRDNGPGIDPAFRERAFQLFQRGADARAGGSGAGLSIVKRIVEQHGGQVWIEDAANGGADFRFTLPKARGLRELAPAPPPAAMEVRLRDVA